MQHLLPHIAAEVREARVDAGLSFAHVAVHVRKPSGKLGVSESTLLRFERARCWPENPDAIVQAYAQALDVEPRRLWARALKRWARALTDTAPLALMSPSHTTKGPPDGQSHGTREQRHRVAVSTRSDRDADRS